LLRDRIDAASADLRLEFEAALEGGSGDLRAAAAALQKLQYLDRIGQEVDRREAALLDGQAVTN
jgi:hypothetical protein